jgi:glycine/D-amino acid oxidase-like deaminating enzyme
MKNIVVIGGGIIGLSSAFYLQRAGLHRNGYR